MSAMRQLLRRFSCTAVALSLLSVAACGGPSAEVRADITRMIVAGQHREAADYIESQTGMAAPGNITFAKSAYKF